MAIVIRSSCMYNCSRNPDTAAVLMQRGPVKRAALFQRKLLSLQSKHLDCVRQALSPQESIL